MGIINKSKQILTKLLITGRICNILCPPDYYVNSNIILPPAGDYGVGMVFLPRQIDAREKCMKEINKVVESENQIVLGWRDTPVNETVLGKTAKENRPYICQIFIGKSIL